MSAVFASVHQHVTEVSPGVASGRLVLSRMTTGDSPIYCATPSLKYVVDGEERYEIDGVQHVVRAGQFLLVEAGSRLRVIIGRRQPAVGLGVYLPQGDCSPFVALAAGREQAQAEAGGRAVVLSASGTALGAHLREAGRLIANDPGLGSLKASATIEAAARLLGPVAADVRASLARLPAARGITRRDLLQRLDRARAWLHDCDDRAVALDELSRVAGMSHFHLLRSFAAAFGETPAAYHRRLRLERAQLEISSGRLGTADAGERFGFTDGAGLRRAGRRRAARSAI